MSEHKLAGHRTALLLSALLGLLFAVMTNAPVQASEAELCIKARMWEKISREEATSVCSCISETISKTDVSEDDKARMRLAQASLASALLFWLRNIRCRGRPANEQLAAVGVALAEVRMELFDFVDLGAQFDLSACVK